MSTGSNFDGINVDQAAIAAAATAASAAAAGSAALGGAQPPTDATLAKMVADPPSRGGSEQEDEEGTPRELERLRRADAALAAADMATANQGMGAAAASTT